VRTARDRKDKLLDAGLTLASELSLPLVLQRIVDLAAEVTDARYGALGVIGDDGQLTEFVTTGVTSAQRKAIGALPHGRGLLGYVISHPKPLRVPDISAHSASVGFPRHHPKMTSFVGTPVRAMGKVYGNIYLAEKRDADEFTADDEKSLVVLAAQAGAAIANASLYEEMRQRQRWLDALRGIATEILAGTRAESLLTRIADSARELADAQTATIVTTTSTPDELVVAAAAGKYAASLRGLRVPASDSISGEVMRTGRPLVFIDASLERKAYPPMLRAARNGPAIFAPLHVQGRATGTVMVANQKGGRVFNEYSVRMVETFADQASVAIEYGRAQADQQRLGLMDERERIAKELHDGIIQSLFAVGMGLQATALMSGSPDVVGRIDSAVNELDHVIRDLRSYIFGLQPGVLADRRLDQALRALAEDVSRRSGIQVDVKVDPEAAPALSAQSHEIVQLTREALSNVTRHARAGRASISLERRNGMAILTIRDDGTGFDPAAGARGSGLRNMRARATAMDGRLRVITAPGKGTRLVLSVPMDRRRADRPRGDGTAGTARGRTAVGR